MRKFKIVVEGKSYEVEVEEINADNGQQISTITAPVATAPKPISKTGTELTSPMPGTILNLSVAEGASVKRGDTILVLEAMKMENDISANADGKVSFVVSKGASVNTGDVLAIIS